MNWKLKAFIQTSVSLFPDPVAQPLYYFIQKKFGAWGDPDFSGRYQLAAKFGVWAGECRDGLQGKTVLEVGTGRTLDLPIALWLMGAEKVITVDLNTYLRPELVPKSIAFLLANREEYTNIFSVGAERDVLHERFDILSGLGDDFNQIIQQLNIEYMSPADATRVPLDDDSIDYHVSLNVLEHIPEGVIRGIMCEAKRLLKPKGAMIHFIDPSDHFAHSDESISAVNFLKFSELQWKLIGGNRFMYHNRMRARDYSDLFENIGLETVKEDEQKDPRSLEQLQNGFSVDAGFLANGAEQNAITRYHVLLS